MAPWALTRSSIRTDRRHFDFGKAARDKRGFFFARLLPRITYDSGMSEPGRMVRKTRPAGASKAASRSSILAAARRVAARDGARDMSLRAVAAEAGFAPAALYGYFRGKDDLLLALAAEDLSS